MFNYHPLKYQWDFLFHSFKVNSAKTDQVFQEILNLYSQSHRYYHNLTHIKKMLAQVQLMKSLAINFENILVATWFHDCIYDTHKNDNEEKSADYAINKLKYFNIDKNTINQIKNLILITKNHQSLYHNIDEKILLDADLSILGSSYDEYHNYTLAIRKEYSWVSDIEYYQKRKEFFKKLLDKDKIYQTSILFEKLEDKAILNIQKEIIYIKNKLMKLKQ